MPRSVTAALTMFVALGVATAAAGADRPNIVLIIVDDLRHDGVAATGHPFVQTPNIDWIASEGMTFSNAFVTTPLCSPSRASFYTGQYARSHQITGNAWYSLVSDATLMTWAATLQEAGYHTAHIGKWHMDGTSAPRYGFDHWVAFKGQGTHTNPLLNINGEAVQSTGFTTDLLTDEAIAFVQQNHGGSPFAMVLSYKAVHGPFPPDNSNVPEAFRSLYENEPITRPPNAVAGYTLDGKPMLQNPPPGLDPPIPGTTGTSEAVIRNKLRMTSHVDENVGRLLTALGDSGVIDDTVILFTSDHSYFYGEHGLADKRAAYEASIRIPLLLRYPDLVQGGSTSDALVLNVDVAPTLMELAGVTVPSYVQGESLLPLLQNPNQTVRSAFLAEYWYESGMPRIASWKAIRTASWKYITYPELGPAFDELYDLDDDPYEMFNRVEDPEAQATLTDMMQEMAVAESRLETGLVERYVPGSTLDYGVTEAGTLNAPGGRSLPIGSSSPNPPGGRNAVFVFELPVLLSGERVGAASVRFRLSGGAFGGIGPDTHADAWVLGIGDETPRLEYLEADADPVSGHFKLDDDILWWDHTASSSAIDLGAARNLGLVLSSFYASRPSYSGGSYLHIRLNPDHDTGSGDAGWNVITADYETVEWCPALVMTMDSTWVPSLSALGTGARAGLVALVVASGLALLGLRRLRPPPGA